MFTSITIKDVATYSHSGVVISELTKLNYFFGNNGSGKSTLAKYLNSLGEKKNDIKYSTCSFQGFDINQEEIIVFNQDFIENNFKNNDAVKGVFSLNQTNKTIDDQIKANENSITEKTKEQNIVEKENSDIQTNRDEDLKKLSDKCFSRRDVFKTFSKIRLEYSGNKKSNFNYIKSILEKGDITSPTLDELTSLYKKLYEDKLEKIGLTLNINLFDELDIIQNDLNLLLEEIIVGKDDVKLAELIQQHNLKSWVLQGKQYLEKTGKICPFCQQSINDDFVSQLNAMFDESSKQKVDIIKSKKINYESKFSKLLENIQSVVEKYNEGNIVSNLQIQLRSILTENIKLIEEKIKAPNERKTIKFLGNKIKENIDKINNAIKENDDTLNSIDTQKKALISKIWNYLANDCKSDIEKYKQEDKENEKKFFDNNSKIQRLKDEIEQLKQQNAELRMQTVNTKEAVDNINQILKNSGFMGFEILEKDKINNISQYYLSRIGSNQQENIFNSLSEGEKNFISFLYFYQLCFGTTDIQSNSSKKKIIVIDDPVSSMDSQVLFIVSTLVNRLITYKEKTNPGKKEFLNSNICQVFILTHNYYFYKEVAMDKRPICKNQTHYLISKKSNNETQIEKREYKARDDYSLMWETVRNVKKTLDDSNKEQNILLANLFRRILESYANFIGLGNDSWATVMMDDNKDSVEHYLKCAFVSMINDESHKVSPFDSLYFHKIHNEKPSKLFSVFESIFMDINGKDHYEKMMLY